MKFKKEKLKNLAEKFEGKKPGYSEMIFNEIEPEKGHAMKYQFGDVIKRDGWCPLRILGVTTENNRPHYQTLKACVGQPLKRSPDARVPMYAERLTHSASFLDRRFEKIIF
jgi:hypothetical protein